MVRLRDLGARDVVLEVDDVHLGPQLRRAQLAARRARAAAGARPAARLLEGAEPRPLRRRSAGCARAIRSACPTSRRRPRRVTPPDADPPRLDPQPAHRSVHHRRLRVRHRHPAPARRAVARRPRTSRRARCAAATPTPPRCTRRAPESQRRRAGDDFDDRRWPSYTTILATTRRLPARAARTHDVPVLRGPTIGRLEFGPPDNDPARRVLRAAGLTRDLRSSPSGSPTARATPDDYVQRVLAHLGAPRFTYSETPPPPRGRSTASCSTPSQGYCQQFSGAMALLLRMGGIPARVATGFSTGATRHQDRRAHRPRLRRPLLGRGLLPRTRAGSRSTRRPPPRRPAASRPTPPASRQRERRGGAALRRRPARRARRRHPGAGESAPWWRTRRSALAARLSPPRASRRPSAAGAAARRPRSRELERALRRTRRAPAPGTTLHALELRFSATPAAAGYVRALRESRYARRAGHPTRAQRRGPALRAGPRRRACSAACVRGGRCRPGNRALTIDRMDDVYDLYQRGMALLEDGHFHQATIPLAKARDLEPDKTSIREALGPRVLPLRRLRGGARGVRGRRRARADQRLRALLPRPLADAARPDRGGAQAADAGGADEPERRDYRIYRDRARKAA